MNRINDGGPAFPLPVNDEQCRARFDSGYGGMSLRDYFAAKFAAAMMTATSANHNFPHIDYQRDVGGPTVAERVATIAYRMADAMLRTRKPAMTDRELLLLDTLRKVAQALEWYAHGRCRGFDAEVLLSTSEAVELAERTIAKVLEHNDSATTALNGD